jgi:hypothetical protein
VLPPSAAAPSRATLISLADAEARAPLAALFRALAGAPGALYPLVYVGPLPRGELVRCELESACRERGLRLGGPREEADVALASLTDFVAGGFAARQTVVWGALPFHAIPPPAARALMGALPFDPADYADLTATGWSLASVLARAASAPGRAVNPVIVEGHPDTLGVLAAEARMRLGVRGVYPVEVVSASDLVRGDPAAGVGEGGAVVVRAGLLADPAQRSALVEALAAWSARGVQAVVVGERATRESLLADRGWKQVAARAALVMAADELGVDDEDDAAWPALGDLLPGHPALPPEVEAPTFPLRAFTLRDVLEIADARRESGTILVYAADRLGWIEVADGAAVDAARLGDPEGAAPGGLLSARVQEMGTWDDGTVVVVSGSMLPRAGVGLSTLAYDLTRLADERATGRAPALDPRVTGRAPLPPHRVANALIARGLVRPALTLLRAVEEGPGWGAEDDVLLAMLLATDDPQGATLRLRRAIFRLAAAPNDPSTGALQRDATLAALLLEVRGRQMRPAAAWETVERWLDAAGAAWVDSERRAAVVAELALRAGCAESAAYFLQGVAHYAGPDHPLVRTLAVHASPAPPAPNP